MFEDILVKIANADTAQEGDYLQDGLLWCGRCKTAKQGVVVLLGTPQKVPILCRCAGEAIAAQKAKEEKAAKERKIKSLRKAGLSEARLKEMTFAHDDGSNPALSAVCKRYVERFDEIKKDGMGLIFFGSVGSGKTFFCACIANALIDKGVTVLMTNLSNAIDTLFAMNGEEKLSFFKRLQLFDLIVFDDLGVERETDYMQKQAQRIIDARYLSGKPMIFTTNLTKDALKNPAGIDSQRMIDRILERCHPIEVKGESHRRTTLKENFAQRQRLLGL